MKCSTIVALAGLALIAAVQSVSASFVQHSPHHLQHNGDHIRRQIAHEVNSNPASTWTAGVSSRWQGKPIEAIKRQLGVTDLNKPQWEKPALKIHTGFDAFALPLAFDSRQEWPNCPTIQEVRDQSDCGSCWAFAAVEAASDRICIGTKATVNAHLSAEDMTSCCTSCGNGCDGGDPGAAWDYLASTGIVTGGNYGDDSWCSAYSLPNCEHHNNHTTYPPCGTSEYATPACPTACDADSTYKIPFGSDSHIFASSYSISSDPAQIQQEILTNGPVEVAFSVYADFEAYTGGVYQHVTGAYLGGHAVKILGWGVDESTSVAVPYWLVANSWNSDWGEKGFFRILRGSDECGIEDNVVAGLYK